MCQLVLQVTTARNFMGGLDCIQRHAYRPIARCVQLDGKAMRLESGDVLTEHIDIDMNATGVSFWKIGMWLVG